MDFPTPDEVHLWQVNLDPGLKESEVPDILSSDEMSRVNRLVDGESRRRFAIGRAALRVILSGYLDIPPEQIKFCVSKNGKPGLCHADLTQSLYFNVSHSGSRCAIAVATRGEVGIDIEQVRSIQNITWIAQQYFSPEEIAQMDACSADERLGQFIRCWTRKEAFGKARGTGLTPDLRSYSILSRRSNDPWQVVDRQTGQTVGIWRGIDRDLSTSIISSIVFEGDLALKMVCLDDVLQPNYRGMGVALYG